MASSPTNLGLDETPMTVEHLLSEYDNWQGTLSYSTGEFDEVPKIVALYRFAIAHFNEPGTELLLKAIAAFEAAEAERREPVSFSD